MASINEPHHTIDFCDDLPVVSQLEDLSDRNMQLKGLAVKTTPINADSAVIRHERPQEQKNCDVALPWAMGEKFEATTSVFEQCASATWLSVGPLPDTDRCHLGLGNSAVSCTRSQGSRSILLTFVLKFAPGGMSKSMLFCFFYRSKTLLGREK